MKRIAFLLISFVLVTVLYVIGFDGLAEIVVQDAAGTVYCLGAAPRP